MPQFTWFQYVVFMVTINLGTALTGTPSLISNYTVRSGWIAALLMSIGVIVSASIVEIFIRIFPKKTLNQAYQQAFGKKVGWIFGLWMVFWFYVTDCIVFKEVMMFLGDAIFPNTPAYLLGLPMLVLMFFVLWLDIQVIARMIEFSLPIIIGLLVVIPLAMMNLDIKLLFPLAPDSWSDVWKASVSPIFTYTIELMVSLMLVDVIPDEKRLSQYLLLAGGIIVAIHMVGELMIILVLGDASKNLIYPVLEIVRSIRIGKYIERLDTIIVMGIITSGFFKLSLFHYGMVKSLQEISFVTSKRSVIYLTAVAIWAGSEALFPTNKDAMEALLKFTPSYFIFSLLLLPLFAILAESLRVFINQKIKPQKSM